MVAEVRDGIVWDDQSKRFRDSSTGKFVNPDSAPSPGQYDSKQLDAIAKQLQQLAAAQQRIEQRLKRRDERERDESTWVARQLNDITDTLNAPGVNAVLTLTAVITLFTGIAVGGRLAYNGYQTLLAAIPGMQPGEVARNQEATTWEQLFEGGSDSLMAIAIGSAEGTRTPDGGKTADWNTHPDPGNGVMNQGTFSYQHGASSPQEADQKQLERLKGQMAQVAPQLSRKDVVTWLNAADLLNQSPAAGMNFPKYLKDCNGDILCARVKSFEGDAPGITRNGLTIEEDQGRRMEQIRKAIAANQSKTSVSVTVGRVFPIPGKTHATAEFTSGYGPRSSPGGVGSTFHQGYDYAAPVGTPLLAIESGTVTTWKDGSCGNGIELKAKERSFIYCHLDQVKVTSGQQVTVGSVIGTVGNTGASTGPHLHIGIKENGEYINPGDYLKSLPGELQQKPTASPGTAQSYFQELSSAAEFGSSTPKPFGPMRFKVIGNPTPEDRATLAAVVSELNAMGANIQEVQSGENVELHYAPEAQFPSIEPNYRPRNVGFFWRTGNRGRILISTTGVNQQERSHLIREEMTQLVTGLFKDSNRYPDSIFYQGWTATQQYSEIDKQVIQMALER